MIHNFYTVLALQPAMVDRCNKGEKLTEVSFNSSFGADLDSELISNVDKLVADYCAKEQLRSESVGAGSTRQLSGHAGR